MSDQTLLDTDIASRADGLLRPFDPDRVRGASYDISVGDNVIVALSARQGGYKYVNLALQRTEVIPPGHTAIVSSKEHLMLPTNMKARLSLRADYATRMVFFAGGIVDPGFATTLWLPIANLSTREFEIHYDERMFRIEFILLEGDAKTPVEQKRDIPTLPLLPDDPVYDLGKLTAELTQSQSQMADLQRIVERHEPTLVATGRIVDVVVLGALGGIGAGSAAGGIIALFTQLPSPWNYASGGVASLVALAAASAAALGPLGRLVAQPRGGG